MKIAHAMVLCLTRARWLELASERGIVRKKLALLTLQTATAAIPLATPPSQPSAPFIHYVEQPTVKTIFRLAFQASYGFISTKIRPLNALRIVLACQDTNVRTLRKTCLKDLSYR